MSNSEIKSLIGTFSRFNKPDAIGVEIGSLHGRSSYEISKAINKGVLYCIDNWGGYDSYCDRFSDSEIKKLNYPPKGSLCTLEFFLENTKDCKNIITIKGNSPNVVKNWDKQVDFVFLDAMHKNPSDWDNIEFWISKIKSGGLLSGHDYFPKRNQWPDVHDNVIRLEKQLGKKVINPQNTSIWYFEV